QGWVALAHGTGKFDCSGNGFVARETDLTVRCLIAELPQLQIERLCRAILLAFLVVWIVGVRHPFGGLAGVAGPIPLRWRTEALCTVANEIDAVERLGADAAAEIDELVGADAVGLLSTPEVIADGRAFRHRAHAFTPFVVPAVEAAEAHRPGREILHGVDE